MGLCVSVYRKVKTSNSEEGYSFTACVPDKSWRYKIKNLEEGKDYEGVPSKLGISYGYGQHNRFREELIELIGRKDLLLESGRINWYLVEKEKDMPFHELIYFSDCEGCLDFEISDILYKNFLDWKEAASSHFGSNSYNLSRYMDWLIIFEVGKDPGSVVVFS